jgi:outer membrane receptor for ferrienterochelin and colicins
MTKIIFCFCFCFCFSFCFAQEVDSLPELVISATMKPVSRLDCTIPVEVYHSSYFQKNPTPSLFEALQIVNGVRPQVNCNVCNTGDIHINGMEGPYTMILIDGMPIIGSLSSIYGLNGIPNALIDRIEIVKGPASALYGSEAVGGLINVITKAPDRVPRIAGEISGSTWEEATLDLGIVSKLHPRLLLYHGVSVFYFNRPTDHNSDGFTDVTLQKRLSLFEKLQWTPKNGEPIHIAMRCNTEDRWGGQMNWDKDFRGSDSIYGESIVTNRAELILQYPLPTRERFRVMGSYSWHQQQSWYGTMPFHAHQHVGFGQLVWDKVLRKHDVLAGIGARWTYFNDNTVVTEIAQRVWLPGLFVQDEISLNDQHKLLFGFREDHHPTHGFVHTGRVGYKWKWSNNAIVRLNAGTGFRAVNVFSEDHAALTGARRVVLAEALRPEQSENVNVNLVLKHYGKVRMSWDAQVFYTRFSNRIVSNLDIDPNSIVYTNLNGSAYTAGASLNWNLAFGEWDMMCGATWLDTRIIQAEVIDRPILTERYMGTWTISRKISPWNLVIDYSGNIIGPMRLPLLGSLDPRPAYSPVTSVQNIQLTWKPSGVFQFSIMVKNILNQLPGRNAPFLIARAHDPFDQLVQWDGSGQVMSTAENPYALTFDPTYVYMANQGIRVQMAIRFRIG